MAILSFLSFTEITVLLLQKCFPKPCKLNVNNLSIQFNEMATVAHVQTPFMPVCCLGHLESLPECLMPSETFKLQKMLNLTIF